VSFSLPSVGDVQGQVQAGNNLISQINDGDTAALAEAGVALVNAVTGESKGALAEVLGLASGALSGLIAAGPVGAAVGLISSAIADFSSLFGGYVGVTHIYGMSHATEIIASRVASMASSSVDTESNNPQGWFMSDYLATALPPSTGNQAKLAGLLETIFSMCSSPQGQTPDPFSISCVSQAAILGNTDPSAPLCTPVFFNWFNSAAIADCSHNLVFGSSGAKGVTNGTPSALLQQWVASTRVQNGLTQSQIVQNAIARAPDPIYWSSSLYGAYIDPTIGSAYTVFWNPDLLNAMATVLMMLSVGCSTQSIVSELLIQSAIMDTYGTQLPNVGCNTSPNSGDICVNVPGNAAISQAGFHALVDDYIALANAENAAAGITDYSTADKIGMLLVGATGACVVGLLGYSAVTRTSPLVALKQVGGRLRRLHLP
jgi:hypothetical protein